MIQELYYILGSISIGCVLVSRFCCCLKKKSNEEYISRDDYSYILMEDIDINTDIDTDINTNNNE